MNVCDYLQVHRPDFDSQERVALSGALLGVAHAGHGETTAARLSTANTLTQLVLGVSDEIVPEVVNAPSLAEALKESEQRDFAAELLVLVALVDTAADPGCVAAVTEYCRALDRSPENLDLLHEVVQRKIRHSRHHLYRRFLADSLRTGSFRDDAIQLKQMFDEHRDHPEIAAPYLALENLPDDTFGNHFFHFYRNRGFKFPGEKGALPLAWGFEVHDTAHLLSGYNTDPSGEINVVAFQSAATTRMPWLVLGVNLTTFNSGLAYGPTALLHYEPHVGNLDPVEFVRAFDRGLRVRADLSGDFDIHEHWEIPMTELRERLGVDGHGDVRQPAH